MPALYNIAVQPSLPTPGWVKLAGPVLELHGGNGDVISLTGWGDGFGAGANTSGILGIPPAELRLRDTAGDGAVDDGVRYPTRPIDLEVTVESRTPSEQRARLDRLAAILNRRHGPARLLVVPPDGGAARARWIGVRYASGWDGATTPDFNLLYEQIPLTFTAPRPVFRAVTPRTVAWTVGSSKPFLSDTEDFFPIILGAGRVLGAVELSNPGDEDAPAVWRIVGPGGPITIAPGIDAPGYVIDTTLEEHDLRFVSTEDATLTTIEPPDEDGAGGGDVNVYDEFGPVPWLWPIPPGNSLAVVQMANAIEGAEILLQFWPQYGRGY